ncbi:MAG: hypothetical protein AB1798_17125, partial [Spirochaetota bacterium]
MKRFLFLSFTILVVSAVLVITACYWNPVSKTGDLTLRFDSGFLSRSISTDADTAWVYLKSESGSFLQFSDTGQYYFEGSTASTLEIPNIPAGKWNVLLALGNKTTGAFIPSDYGESGFIMISPGVKNNAAVVSSKSPLLWSTALAGSNVTGAVTFGSSIFASTGANLYSGSSITNMAELAPLSGYTIYSISEGLFFGTSAGSTNPELWINTDKGIIPYRSSTYLTNFQKTQFLVRQSGARFSATPENQITIFFKTEKGFGGLNVKETNKDETTPWEWKKYDEFAQNFTGDMVYDFVIHGDFGYFATKLGAFRLNKDKVETGGSEDFFADADFFKITIGGDEIPIYGIKYQTSDTLIITTGKGVFKAAIDAGATVISNATRISGTEGLPFTLAAVSDNGAYAAALSEYGLYLIKWEGDTYKVKTVPFYAGLPGRVTALIWMD